MSKPVKFNREMSIYINLQLVIKRVKIFVEILKLQTLGLTKLYFENMKDKLRLKLCQAQV